MCVTICTRNTKIITDCFCCRVVCICTGGNIDSTTLARALERGMAAEGRLIKFKVIVVDRPGGMADLCTLLASIGVTVRDCVPERAWIKGDVFSCEVSQTISKIFIAFWYFWSQIVRRLGTTDGQRNELYKIRSFLIGYSGSIYTPIFDSFWVVAFINVWYLCYYNDIRRLEGQLLLQKYAQNSVPINQFTEMSKEN